MTSDECNSYTHKIGELLSFGIKLYNEVNLNSKAILGRRQRHDIVCLSFFWPISPIGNKYTTSI